MTPWLGTDALSDISMLALGSRREFAELSSEALKRKDLVVVVELMVDAVVVPFEFFNGRIRLARGTP